mgnify:FL=1
MHTFTFQKNQNDIILQYNKTQKQTINLYLIIKRKY